MSKRYPRNIQKQIDAAQKIEDELRNPPPAPEPEPAPAPAEPEPAPPHPPEPSPDPSNTPEYWRARFQTTEGMIRRQQEDHERAIKERDQKLSELTAQVEQLQQQQDSGREPELNLRDHFSEEEIAQHGEGHLRSVLAAAMRTNRNDLQKSIDRALAPLKKELDDTRKAAAEERQVQQKGAQEAFYQELDRAVPSWRQVNTDPRFIAYCGDVDDKTGFERQQILNAAVQRKDHVRVAGFFNEFLKSVGAQTTQRSPERRLHPEGAAAGGDPPAPKPLISEAEIRQFQNDVARGRYRGRQQELTAMQNRIDEAYRANRIS